MSSSHDNDSGAKKRNEKPNDHDSSNSELGFVTTVKPTDILCGRGHKIIRHPGNRDFRNLVSTRKTEYASSGNYKKKNEIARQIIDEISSRKGRFLRKVTEIEAKELGVPEGVDAWTIAEDAVTLEKTKQLLREKEAVISTSSSQDAAASTRVKAEFESATRVTSSQGQQYSFSAASSQHSGTGLLGLLQNAAIGTSDQQSQHLESMLLDIQQTQAQRHMITSILSAQRITPQQFPLYNLWLLHPLQPQQQSLILSLQREADSRRLLDAARHRHTGTHNQTVSNLLYEQLMQRLQSSAGSLPFQLQGYPREGDRQSLIDVLPPGLSTLQPTGNAAFLSSSTLGGQLHLPIPSSSLPIILLPGIATQQANEGNQFHLQVNHPATPRASASSFENNACAPSSTDNYKCCSEELRDEAKYSPKSTDSGGSVASITTPPHPKKRKRTKKR